MYELDLQVPLTELELNYVHAAMRRVEEMSPYASTCHGWLTKVGKEFRARLEVKSQVGLFTGDSHSDDLREAMDEAESQVKGQIEEWRRNRFRDQELGTYKSIA